MNNKHDIKKDEYYCNYCNKKYKTYKTLWEHNKKFHIIYGLIKTDNSLIKTDNSLIKTEKLNKDYKCRYCSKIYNNKNSRWSHEKICQLIIKENNDKIEKVKENKEKELELQILKLKLKLEKSTKIDNITLKQLNKKLLERNNLIKNSNINSHNKIQNNNIFNNTFQLVGFAKEDIIELLTIQEKKQIMNAKFYCLEKLIEIIHCGKYNQFKNIIITNMKDNYIYKYDDNKSQFILSMKSSVLNSLIDCRVSDIEIIYNELIENNKLDNNTKDIIEKFINKINNEDDKFIDFNGVQYDTYKHYKINEVKVLLYNNQDKITNDISLILTTTDELLPIIK
jgi:hypothetical protein